MQFSHLSTLLCLPCGSRLLFRDRCVKEVSELIAANLFAAAVWEARRRKRSAPLACEFTHLRERLSGPNCSLVGRFISRAISIYQMTSYCTLHVYAK